MTSQTIKKYNKKSISQLKKKAQKVFNAYIRSRDLNGEYFECISCGKTKPKSVMHAGHFFSVGGHSAVRFDEMNVHGQCAGCNTFKHGNLYEYQKRLIEKIGREEFESLEVRAYQSAKFGRYELIETIEKYENKS